MLEWWRVEQVESPWLLRLKAEMVMPGEGWLQYELVPDGDGTLVRQTATFDPKGVLGRLYWYAVLPFHHFVFNGTLQGHRARVHGPGHRAQHVPAPGRVRSRDGRRISGEARV